MRGSLVKDKVFFHIDVNSAMGIRNRAISHQGYNKKNAGSKAHRGYVNSREKSGTQRFSL